MANTAAESNVNVKEAHRWVSLLLSRVKPRRWVLIPTRPCDADANNSLSRLSGHPFGTIAYIFATAGVFDRANNGSYQLGSIDVLKTIVAGQKRPKARLIVVATKGLDQEECSCLFVMRGEPRAKELQPTVVPHLAAAQIRGGTTHAKTPLPAIKLSEKTTTKLLEFYTDMIACNGVESPGGSPMQSSPVQSSPVPASPTSPQTNLSRSPISSILQALSSRTRRRRRRSSFLLRHGKRLTFATTHHVEPPRQIARYSESHTRASSLPEDNDAEAAATVTEDDNTSPASSGEEYSFPISDGLDDESDHNADTEQQDLQVQVATAQADPNDIIAGADHNPWSPPGEMVLAVNLDFDKRDDDGLRPSRFGDGSIPLSKKQRPDEKAMRWAILLVAHRFGYQRPELTRKQRKSIAAAACRLVAYDWGFKKPLAGSSVELWDKEVNSSLVHGATSLQSVLTVGKIGNQNKQPYTRQLDTQHPGYLIRLFRQAQKLEGDKATWIEYASAQSTKWTE
ncbi:hypothetical protein SEMRO_2690_G334710.1 [Seminavis robusta]|uniref:Uncharacterized protein n=1 Tax=Seminavis robusta TaxID=568900 RepID=A0A9N8HY38_9STRA|nr:hypothetical protein SEMRO_2690_G334710.1 [Seminavis robusta]|eukprot:Sro2690_g334710.1 n/a (510) ;mRNA; r:6514-8173